MNKPNIRFKGFEDEWQSLPISEDLDLRRGLTYKPSDIRKKGDGILVLRSSNINIDTFVNNDDDVYVTDEAINIPFLNEGDLLFTAANGSTRLVGKHCVVNKLNHRAVHGGFMLAGKSQNPAFTHAWLSAPWYLVALPSFISGGNGALGNLKPLDLLNTKVPYPTSQNERNKIGTFFKQIDEMIAEAEREVSRLEKMKQASLQKMFPRPGATAPEIRFNGYTEPWVERKISEFASFSRGQGYTKNDLRESGTPIFLYGRLYTKYSTYVDSVDTYSFLAPYSVISKGNEVVMPSSGETAEDIAVASAILTKGIILSGGLNIIISSNDIDQIFLALSLTFSHTHYELAKKAQGKSVVHIYNQDIADLTISCPPTLDEQKTIGEYFRNLDSLLDAKRQKLVKLRNVKQACLDKMFVNTSDL